LPEDDGSPRSDGMNGGATKQVREASTARFEKTGLPPYGRACGSLGPKLSLRRVFGGGVNSDRPPGPFAPQPPGGLSLSNRSKWGRGSFQPEVKVKSRQFSIGS